MSSELAALQAAFHAKDPGYWATFEAALTTHGTTLEAQRGREKEQFGKLVEASGITFFHSSDLADALLAYFANTPNPKKSPRPTTPTSFQFTTKVAKGASYRNLRRFVFRIAESSYGHDATVVYTSPVTADSDLDVELFFMCNDHAMKMETLLVQGLRDEWGDATIPPSRIEPSATAIRKPVYAQHYDDALSQARVAAFPKKFRKRAARTTVTDVEEIELESVVDQTLTNCRFERCHINAATKRKCGDNTEGDWIPLPSDWHALFHAYTVERKACISILADKVLEDKTPDGRQAIIVHVYFAPHCTPVDGLLRHQQLRGGKLVRRGKHGGAVFEVTVWKRESDKFVEELMNRHDQVMLTWDCVP